VVDNWNTLEEVGCTYLTSGLNHRAELMRREFTLQRPQMTMT